MPTVGSLFAGVEGFGQGFEEAGFTVAWQVEIDKDAVSVLERHYPNVRRYRDVREVDPADLPPVDVVTFGSPCQDLSVARSGRTGLGGARSGLFHEATRIIGGIRPVFALWENVTGALSSNSGRDFAVVLSTLAQSGAMDISWRVLDAQWFGVAQRRRRLFTLADFGGERAASVLFETRDDRRAQPGPRALPEVVSNCLEASGFRRSQSGNGFTYVVDEHGVRWFTPREAERLMGWPDDWTRYRADGSEIPDGPRYRMIGNGVVRNVSAWIGRRLLAALKDGAS